MGRLGRRRSAEEAARARLNSRAGSMASHASSIPKSTSHASDGWGGGDDNDVFEDMGAPAPKPAARPPTQMSRTLSGSRAPGRGWPRRYRRRASPTVVRLTQRRRAGARGRETGAHEARRGEETAVQERYRFGGDAQRLDVERRLARDTAILACCMYNILYSERITVLFSLFYSRNLSVPSRAARRTCSSRRRRRAGKFRR